jgi:hypothetical protein
MQPLTPELKAAIFADLEDRALDVISRMGTVPGHELSQWLLAQVGPAIGPYVQMGIQDRILCFWFGMILGQRLKPMVERDEVPDGHG